MNSINIIGRCSSNILKNYTESQKAVFKFSIGCDNAAKNEDGEKTTSFFDCEAWEKVGERIYDNVKKGDKIALSGHLVQSKFQKQDGTISSKIVIVVSACEFLFPKRIEEEK